jgi:hypothetical protein
MEEHAQTLLEGRKSTEKRCYWFWLRTREGLVNVGTVAGKNDPITTFKANYLPCTIRYHHHHLRMQNGTFLIGRVLRRIGDK